jgi:NAD(P)-dependent dehydrogenase (short-subunit alcohol dehydrogenase family)
VPASQTVVITGVSRGLGRALIDQMIALGHTVAGCSRSASPIAELTHRYPAPHHFRVVDVAMDEQVGGWAEEVLSALGPPDLLVNNAALINANVALWKVPPGEFGQVIDVNIKGVYYVLRHFVPAMVRRGRGVIVNLSSGWGRSTSSDVAPYCATKWAIEGLTQALAEELPAGMAAVPLNPGIIHTEMLESCFGRDAAAYPSPQQWAATAAPFLLGLGPSDNGRPLTTP